MAPKHKLQFYHPDPDCSQAVGGHDSNRCDCGDMLRAELAAAHEVIEQHRQALNNLEADRDRWKALYEKEHDAFMNAAGHVIDT